jgi:hypothetical protein
MLLVRWIGSLVVAACLLAAGAARPVRAAELDPAASQLAAAAEALAGKVLPCRHGAPAPEQRRSAAPLLAIVPPSVDVAPPRRSLSDRALDVTSAHAAVSCPARSARGPPA